MSWWDQILEDWRTEHRRSTAYLRICRRNGHADYQKAGDPFVTGRQMRCRICNALETGRRW